MFADASDRAMELVYAIGVVRAPWVALGWLVAKRHRILVRDLSRPIAAPTRRVPQASWSFLGRESGDELTRLNPRLGPAEIEQRFAVGHECLGARLEGRLVYHRWHALTRTSLPTLGVELVLAPSDRYMYHVFTAPALRGRGLHSDGMWQALVMAREQGVARCLACIAWWNRPNLHAVSKVGYVPLGDATRWGVGGWSRVVTAGGVHLDPEGRLVT